MKKKSEKIKLYYSGEESRLFWDLVNSLKKTSHWNEMYSLGVALQTLEEQVFRSLIRYTKGYVPNEKEK